MIEELMEYLKERFPNNDFKLTHTRKYHKIANGDSVYCFIAIGDSNTKSLGYIKMGDLLKPASWKTPAKHARGNIFDKASWENAFNQYGMNYLK